ncbi:MAG: exodeoxyribonuclease V subunit alpha [Pseudomonadota bacterium]
MSRRPRQDPAERASSQVDAHLAALLVRLGHVQHPDLHQVITVLCQRVRQGDVCVDLADLAAEPVGLASDEESPAPTWQDLPGLRVLLRSSTLVGEGHPPTPLVLDDHGRLYLYRYWKHEQRIVAALERLARQPKSAVDAAWLHAALGRLFPSSLPENEPDWQKVAGAVAMLRSLCVITGGPGTGKTYTVTKILALLVEQALTTGHRPPRMALLAPTGKAAHRLLESVRSARGSLACDDAVRACIPDQAFTIHRALGAMPGQHTHFRHGEDNPLPVDVVLVDEASMVDVGLMSRLLGALRPGARLILLGDRDQLASVEAGAVLGDLCNSGQPLGTTPALRTSLRESAGLSLPDDEKQAARSSVGDGIVTLRHSYRHAGQAALGELAAVINAQRADELLAGLHDQRWPAVTWMRASPAEPVPQAVFELAQQRYTAIREAGDAATALQALSRFRILGAHRRGAAGVEQLNRCLEHLLLDATAGRGSLDLPGRPLLVTRNDYGVQLYNGDVGLLWPDDSGVLRAMFEGGDSGALRALAPSWLPAHETVYAMTVHKSQGSEFDEVAVVLPPEASPVLTVELLYTAVTRARSAVILVASEEILRHTLGRRVRRRSGLRDALWSVPRQA